jgi:hypothetical protein
LITLKEKIKDFRGYAILCYGNFGIAYKELSKCNLVTLKEKIKPHCIDENDIMNYYKNRPKIMLNIDPIEKEKTWYTGYLSSKHIIEDIKIIPMELQDARERELKESVKELIKRLDQIKKIEKDRIDTLKKAINNTNIYLTGDYVDVYVATSMRNKWGFEEVYDFVQNVFNNKEIKKLNLRYFDPTQSTCISNKDKGLIEGLMLKRARCTIYLAQETDTMGKDSELATTLAQGKPVIVYVPSIDVNIFKEKIKSYPLSYFKKRLLYLKADELFEDPDIIAKLIEVHPKYKDEINKFLKKLDDYEERQIFFTVVGEDEKNFKKKVGNFNIICEILAQVERKNYDKRANTIREDHPLSLQVSLDSGVANGVLVIRNPNDCAKLLYSILTNSMKFHIKRKEYTLPGLEEIVTSTILEEEQSKSPFRIVTDYKKLTNSFWNLYLKNNE